MAANGFRKFLRDMSPPISKLPKVDRSKLEQSQTIPRFQFVIEQSHLIVKQSVKQTVSNTVNHMSHHKQSCHTTILNDARPTYPS